MHPDTIDVRGDGMRFGRQSVDMPERSAMVQRMVMRTNEPADAPATVAGDPDDNPMRAAIETVLIIGGFVAMLFVLPHYSWADGEVRYSQLTAMLTHGTMPDTKYSMMGPIFAVPFCLVGKAFGSQDWWALRYNTFLLIGGVAFFYLALRGKVSARLLRTFILLLVFGSMFPFHQTMFYGEVFTTVLVMTGTIAIVIGKVRPGWIAAVLGVVNTPATLPALTLLTTREIWSTRRLRWALAVPAVIGLILLEAWIRRGNPFTTGYEDNNFGRRTIMPYSGLPGFSYPLFFGLLSLTLSFGKGLLFFAPGLFLPVRARLKDLGGQCKGIELTRLYDLWMTFVIGLMLTYGMYWAWSGSQFWGPRYLLFASVPASFALAIRLFRAGPSVVADIVTVAALMMSLWAGLNGAVYGDVNWPDVCWPDGGHYSDPICFYTPEFSALWYPFVAHHAFTLRTDQWIYLVYGLIVAIYMMWRPAAHLARKAGGRLVPILVRAKSLRW
jgi:hypothetical protein